ncbi:MAG: ATP-dependent protease LonB [Candidatus Thalassarchaeaceae archaeon]|jgi:Lon-like ATP-dependent protease|nr:ATP-dependent protease LonB [Candidatus Thalassarchaeaceae archaeon]MDP7043104.1 ATP-dependent protease LonB [Candidatus Thalassarchaeaceae archaeon]
MSDEVQESLDDEVSDVVADEAEIVLDESLDEILPDDWESGEEFGSLETTVPDAIETLPIAEWIDTVDIESTKDVPVPENLVDRVIGQDAANVVIRKAAEQRRHMMMIGDPGTGKSMLARAMTELMPRDTIEDTLCYPNDEDENEPRVRTVPAGRGDRIIKERRAQLRLARDKTNKTLLFITGFIAAILVWATIMTGDVLTLLFGMLILGFGFMFLRNRLTAGDDSRIPKLLVKHERDDKPPFVDATGMLAGSLLGDVRHDPFQSGGMETPAHDRVEAGAIHKAHGGVLFVDEINLLRLEDQQALLTALQENELPISGRSERSSGALTTTEPVPCDFILVAAGNLDALQGMHPALRSRIRGYGYEVYVNSDMPDTARNRRRLIRFVAQEVANEKMKKSGNPIPHFDRSAIGILLRESQRRAGRRGKLTLRLRELGGLVRVAGDLAFADGSEFATAEHVLRARDIAKPLEQQVADRIIERRMDYSMIVNSGERVGRVNGLAVLGADSGLSDFSGIMLPVEALVTPSHKQGGAVFATGGLSEMAKESVTNVSAVIKKLTGKDVSDFDIHIQFVDTHGVDGDSASITIATAVISALEEIPIDQNLAMTGSLSVRGEVLPIGGVTAKIEAAAKSGIHRIIIPRANMNDVLIDDEYKDMVSVIPVDTLDEVLEHSLIEGDARTSLVTRLGEIVDRLTKESGSPSSA